jgi:hypothetical protein
MTKTASINISQAIACDDIRQEINGKHILIGVYSGNLGVPSFPNVIALGFWVLAKPSQIGDYDVQLRVQDTDGKEVTRGNMLIHVQKVEDTALVIPSMPIPLSKPGEITLQYREGNGSWRTICSLETTLVPAST